MLSNVIASEGSGWNGFDVRPRAGRWRYEGPRASRRRAVGRAAVKCERDPPPVRALRRVLSLRALCFLLAFASGSWLPGGPVHGSPGARGSATVQWLALREPGLEVRYRPGYEGVARSAARAAVEAAGRITAELGAAPDRTLTVILHPTHAAFAEAVGTRRKQMVVGMASGDLAVAHIDASGAVADIDEVVAHEVAHLLLAQAVGGAHVPRWFDEGYAEHAAGSLEWASRELLADHIETGRLLDLGLLTDDFPRDGQVAAVAYAQSHALVTYILKEAPAGALPDLIRRLRAGEAFESALPAATSRSASAWDEAWRRDFRGHSHWYPWIAFLAGASGIAMSVLCILAYRAIRRRTEELDGMEDYDGPYAIRRVRRWRRR